MKLLKLTLLVVATLAMTSCGLLGNLRNKPTSDTYICPSTAFIVLKDYEINGPKDNQDLPRYINEMAKKYPNLKIAYSDLYKCWVHYHGEPQK